MRTKTGTLKDRLLQTSEIKITVRGRKSGRPITNPIWFVLEGDGLYMLPVHGSDTQWYRNVLKNPGIRIEAGGEKAEVQVVSITDPAEVKSVVEKFREKYGTGEVKKYYSKFDAAGVAQLS